MYREVYPSVAGNGIAGAERKAAILREMHPGARISIEPGAIPMWGSAIPTSDTYGRSELGFRVIVEYPDPIR